MVQNSLLFTFSLLSSLLAAEVMLSFLPYPGKPSLHESRLESRVVLHDHEHHFCYGPKNRMRFDSQLIATEHPNQQYFEFRNDGVALHTYDEFGFRKSFREPALTGNVVVLGDSFARGTLVDDTETIPSYLTRWSERVVFVNFGISGHGPSQHYRNYARNLFLYEHDHVLLLHYLGNDALNEVNFSRNLMKAKELRELRLSGSIPLSTKLKDRIKHVLESTHLGKLSLNGKRWVQKNTSAKPKKSAGEIAEFIRNPLREIAALVHSEKKQLTIITIPSREIYDLHNFPEYQVSFQRELMEGQKRIIDELDASPSVRVMHLDEVFSKLDRDILEVYGWPDSHFNEQGYYLASVLIADFLSKEFDLDFLIENQYVDLTHYTAQSAVCPN